MKNPSKVSISRDASVLFVTFSRWIDGKRLPTNGSIEPFRDFIVPRVKKLVLIDQLVPDSESVLPKYEVYDRANFVFKSYPPPFIVRMMKPLLLQVHTSGTSVLFKIRDLLSVILWGITDKTKFDYYIGLESINAIAGIMLRKFGKVKRVIYYVSDYSPNRYASRWFNALYLWLDRFSARNSDYIWDVSRAIQEARLSVGGNTPHCAPVIHVSNGLYPEQIKVNPIAKIDRYALAYMGTVGKENGPDIAIKALGLVRKKFPKATLHIVGGSEKDFSWLQPIIKKLQLEKAVFHHGFIPRASDMADILSRCAIGLAPYRAIPGSTRYYGDAGKIRAYCASGLAIISSQVPPLGKDVSEYGAALIVQDNARSMASAIEALFSNTKLYMKLRNNAAKFARFNTWDNQFNGAFTTMNRYEKKN